jgi:hypothetical protein
MELSQMIALGGALVLILIFSIYVYVTPRAVEFFRVETLKNNPALPSLGIL